MPFPGSPLASPVIPNFLVEPGSPIRHNELCHTRTSRQL
jgi:pumilio RNA-binding family